MSIDSTVTPYNSINPVRIEFAMMMIAIHHLDDFKDRIDKANY